MDTVAFWFDEDTKYLQLKDRTYSADELAREALKAIYNQIVHKRQADRIPVIKEECLVEAQAIPWQIVDGTTLPKDRYFRAALRADKGKFIIDMDHAREIHLDRIREARNIKLAILDMETMKAVGKGDDQARNEIEAQKQILRDIPQTLDLAKAKTPNELRAIWPAELTDEAKATR